MDTLFSFSLFPKLSPANMKRVHLFLLLIPLWTFPALSNPCLTPTPPVITGPSQYCDGTGNVTLDAGSGFTSYLWSPGGETSQTISSGPGTYSVSVVDVNGCTGTSSSFTVEDSTINFVFDLVNFTQDESCPGAADGIVRVLTQDVISPSRIFDFSIDNGATWLSESGQAKVFINLTAGNYTAIVRSRDTPSCLSLPKPYTVGTANTASTAINAIAASASTICPGGTSTLTAAGGTHGTGANIVWYDGPNGTGSQLGTGPSLNVSPTTNTTYYVRREGICNTTTDNSIMITVSPLPTPVISGPNQYCDGTGNITLDAGAGYSSYLWSPGGQSSQTISTADGSYNVTVTDANGCSGTSPNFIVEDSTINFSFDLNNFTRDESCPGAADGILRVLTNDTSFPSRIFDFSNDGGVTWLSETGQAKVFINLTAGTYPIKVRSKYTPSCVSVIRNYTVNSDSERPVLTCQNFQTALNQFGNITISASDVTTSATDNCGINWSTHYMIPNNFSATGIFNVVVYISDFSGNQDTCHAKVTVLPNCNVAFGTSKTEEICDLDEDGSITVTATGGSGNYGFSSDGGNTWTTAASPYTFDNLSDGDYDIQVRDANDTDCVADIQTVSLAQGEVVDFTTNTMDATCSDREDGSIDINVSGAGPFDLVLDGLSSSISSPHTISNLGAGDYQVQIIAPSGCPSEERTITTGATLPPSFDVNVTHVSAQGATDGELEIVVTDGTPSFMFSLDAGNSYQSAAGNSYTFNNLALGLYDIQVKDGNACESARVPAFVSGANFCPPTSIIDDIFIPHPTSAAKDARFVCEDLMVNFQYELTALAPGQSFYFDWEITDIQGKSAGQRPLYNGTPPATDGSISGTEGPTSTSGTHIFDLGGGILGLEDNVSTTRRISTSILPYLINVNGDACPGSPDVWRVYVYPRAEAKLDNALVPGTPIVINSGDDPAGKISIEHTGEITENSSLLLYDLHIDPNPDITELAAGLDQFDVGAINENHDDHDYDAIDLGLSSLTNTSGGAVTITVEVQPISDPKHRRAASKDPLTNPNGYCRGQVETIDITVLPASQNRMKNTLSVNGVDILFRAYPVPTYDHLFIQASQVLEKDQPFELFNLHGQLLLRDVLEAGEHRHKILTNHLTEGFYFIRMINPIGKDAVLKFEKK